MKASPFRSPDEAKARRKKKPKLEKNIERPASKEMRDDGAHVAKLNLMGQRSWPDRLIIPPDVRIPVFVCDNKEDAMRIYHKMKRDKKLFMIEFKRPGKDLTELQEELHAAIAEIGYSSSPVSRRWSVTSVAPTVRRVAHGPRDRKDSHKSRRLPRTKAA